MAKQKIFIGNAQGELREERLALANYVRGSPVLGKVYDVLLSEDAPASGRAPSDVFLDRVAVSDVYVGLFGREYGVADGSGMSPTEREYRQARALDLHRLIFLKKISGPRDPKMCALIEDARDSHARRTFSSTDELLREFGKSIGDHIRELHTQRLEFDRSACASATLGDLDKGKMNDFLRDAKEAKNIGLPGEFSPKNLLSRLKMISKGKPTNAAILMFGKNPQAFVRESSVKCMWFEGTEHAKPMRSYKIFKGPVPDLVRRSVTFILDKLDMAAGRRVHGLAVPRKFEIPGEVVTEAIVNAIVHRDYTLGGSVQVMLYADRFEVLSPGGLPPRLSIASLPELRQSKPRNPTLSGALQHTRYCEKAGTGIMNMIRQCADANVPRPVFTATGSFSIKIWRARHQEVGVSVIVNGMPAKDADVLAVAPGGASARAKSAADGVATLGINSPRLPTTIFAAKPGHGATMARGWIPATDALVLELGRGQMDGSLIFSGHGGFLPGFGGRLEPFREPSGRYGLLAPELSVNGGVPQPLPFELDQMISIKDRRGRAADIRFVDIEGEFSLLEYRMHGATLEISDTARKLLELLMNGPQSTTDLAKALGLSRRSRLLLISIQSLTEEGLIGWTLPGSPKSRMQRHSITETGFRRLSGIGF